MATGVEQATQQERQLVEAKTFSKLASQVIHDLRSPLASLKVAAEFFAETDNADLKSKNAIQLIQLGTKRLYEIAEDLLQKNRTATAGLNIILNEVIDSLLVEFNSRFPKVTTQKNYDSPAIQLAVSRQDIQRAVSNILTNAAEAMNGEGRIMVTTVRQSGSALLQIQDSGPGMKLEVLEKVLKGGFTCNKTDGNGIGMTVVREIVEKYNGQLSAVSKLGSGTTFNLHFPLVQTH